ncbi:nuclear transport factor 2 family protein [Streptomyces minutiscleroticus]|nr:nuclear transport factor 2 family protein [Streptomyces minutiscleroticus]
MTIEVTRLRNPAVRGFVGAVNAHDRDAFRAVLAGDATMSDDGSDRDPHEWGEREVFVPHGWMDVDEETDGGLCLVTRYRNDTWGETRRRWTFRVADDGRISRFETRQI